LGNIGIGYRSMNGRYIGIGIVPIKSYQSISITKQHQVTWCCHHLASGSQDNNGYQQEPPAIQ